MPRPTTVLALLGSVAACLTTAILVIWLTADRARSGDDAAAAPTIRLGQGVRTDFGVMAVERVERLAVAGAAGGDRLDVTVALINLGVTAVPLAVAGVALRSADGTLRPGSPSPAAPPSIAARNSVRVTYSVTLPVAATALQIELTDRSMPRPALVPLGTSTEIPVTKEIDAPSHGH